MLPLVGSLQLSSLLLHLLHLRLRVVMVTTRRMKTSATAPALEVAARRARLQARNTAGVIVASAE